MSKILNSAWIDCVHAGSILPTNAPQKAAQCLGIVEGTVRTVFKTIFSKRDVNRQIELLLLLLSRLSLG